MRTIENTGCGTCLVLEEYPQIDYTLLKRENSYEPWVAAWRLSADGKYWQQGHYFQTLRAAVNYIDSLLKERSAV